MKSKEIINGQKIEIKILSAISSNDINNDGNNDNYIINEDQYQNDLYYEVDVVERLNNYGNYIKQKIENERERQYYQIQQII